MPIKHIDALVLRTADVEGLVAFYRAVGLPLEREKHGEGPVHYACASGGAHIAVYAAESDGSAPPRLQSGASMIGFQVESVEDTYAAALDAGGRSVHEPDDYPWGRRALVLDPDGRAIEFNGAAGDLD